MMEGYLETLSGYINDDDKMVTYKWLSKELGVHVNVAKQVLEEYWTKHKSNNDEPIVATVMLIGHMKDGGMRVEIVKEENLTAAKEKYSKITSQHFYSLQKSLQDIQLLAETEKGDTSYSAIKCEKSNIFSDEELFARRWGSNIKYDNTAVKKSDSSLDNNLDQKKIENKKKGALDSHLKPVNEINSNNDVKIKVDEKVVNKKASPTKNKSSDKKGRQLKNPVQSQSTGFKNLFAKATTSNQNKSPPLNDKSNKDDVETKKEIRMDVDEENIENNKSNKTCNQINGNSKQTSNLLENMKTETVEKKNEHVSLIESKKVTTNGNSKAKSNKNRGNKRQRSEESAKKDSKKRKRIIMVDDSSEESAESDAEANLFDHSPPREPEPEREKPPSPRVQLINGKRKVRKMVDKTFKDEDGFLVTRKEAVYESASDEEIIPVKEVKEIKKSTSDLKPSSKSKTLNKQTTLMSFFKKA